MSVVSRQSLTSVTAVGATEWTNDDTEEVPSFFSGGGFSNLFKRPIYQDTAVQRYLELSGNTKSTPFNSSGRAGTVLNMQTPETNKLNPPVPDVAAQSQLNFIIDGGLVNDVSSTDWSAALFASIVALLTNERVAAGKPGLGFLNPLIYQNPSAFRDMTIGSGVNLEASQVG
jgi:tripeptidyl-peptidase-1